jgi:hypothetical protein
LGVISGVSGKDDPRGIAGSGRGGVFAGIPGPCLNRRDGALRCATGRVTEPNAKR